MKNQNLGKLGENLAVKLLQKNNYKVLERNFHTRFGEIDIIAQEADTLVFVEVKTRFSHKFGPPEEAITYWKIKHIIKAGQYYKILHPKLPEALRIDAVTIDFSPAGEVGEIKIIKNLTG